MMRDNVGTLQFHSYSAYRHAMVLIVRAWIGDILLGYRRLFLLVSVKRAIGLLRCVGCVCVSALSAGSYLYIFPLGFFLIPRTQPLFSTLHLPSLAITTTIPRHHLIYHPFFFPTPFPSKNTLTYSPTCSFKETTYSTHNARACTCMDIISVLLLQFNSIRASHRPPYQLRFVNSGTMMGLQNHHCTLSSR